jgi:xanthine/CO dehydrogenase XdhC/CoxF family maturation factor
MKEFAAILDAYRKIDFQKSKAALATVVRVRGSSYRSPGARMLITDDGRWTGSISGGCLEGDALRKARQVMTDQKVITVTYDTSEESNQNLGIQLGCNGVIDVLIEAVDPERSDNPVEVYRHIVGQSHPMVLATVFSGRLAGEKLLLADDRKKICGLSDIMFEQTIVPNLEDIFTHKKSAAHAYTIDGQEVEVFMEYIQPGISLIIFGGGFDARPVSRLAKSLGWNVTVTDECVAHIAPLFFPAADKLSLCQREFVERDFNITPYTACILMSHNYEYDRDVLKTLLLTETPYIGILGPRKRFDKMLQEFNRDGFEILPEALRRVHSPIGLDIGAEAADEIAVSIIAEIQSKFTNRTGGFLKDRNGPIHQRDTASDQVFKQAYLKISR